MPGTLPARAQPITLERFRGQASGRGRAFRGASPADRWRPIPSSGYAGPGQPDKAL